MPTRCYLKVLGAVAGLDAAAKTKGGVEIGLVVLAWVANVATEIHELDEAGELGVAHLMARVGRAAGLGVSTGVGAKGATWLSSSCCTLQLGWRHRS
uniref:Uncharacterized protein n=1 Tax=Oryza brachyantha TaxID=4533 RepID=J3ND05_ORYBR